MHTIHNNVARTSKGNACHNDLLEIASERAKNVFNHITRRKTGNRVVPTKEMLALPDNEFLLEYLLSNMLDDALEDITPEKKALLRKVKSRAKFLDTVKAHGGTIKSSQVAEHIGKSKVTVKNMKDAGKLLALKMGGDFVYPTFQFSIDDNLTDENGLLNGFVEILQQLHDVDDVMQYGFFVRSINTLESRLNQETSVIEILKHGANKDDLEHILRLARLYGTQNAV
ncbi:hypothetical protein SJI19_22245 [Acerihabitans sp. TG2]|uniref:hypothetical protein n=1 Tax=Acerihabitans sp. TG2 TaxID=3096008 RepID=UPI002B235C80|nr:hypothetical protein [Acerihabitans sp. TG2]MEA9393226.1 hypothetical protein [Acerihabitans sp. TG2]